MHLCKTGKHSTWSSDPYVLAMFFLVLEPVAPHNFPARCGNAVGWHTGMIRIISKLCTPHLPGHPKSCQRGLWGSRGAVRRTDFHPQAWGSHPTSPPSALLCLSKGSLTAAQKWDGVKRILLISSMCGGLGYSELFKSGSFDLSPDPEWLLLPCT